MNLACRRRTACLRVGLTVAVAATIALLAALPAATAAADAQAAADPAALTLPPGGIGQLSAPNLDELLGEGELGGDGVPLSALHRGLGTDCRSS